MIYSYRGKTPKIAASAFIADYVSIIGDVEIGEECSIWFQASLRGDMGPVRVGDRSNIQEGSVLHQGDGVPIIVGKDVTVGHNCTLHSCTIEDGALIGMGAIVLDGAVVGEGSLVGAGSLVTPGMVIPPYSLVMGNPAKVVRTLSEKHQAHMRRNATIYVEKSREYLEMTQLCHDKAAER